MISELKEGQPLVPILVGHDVQKLIGILAVIDGKFIVELSQPMLLKDIYTTFGNIGLLALEYSGDDSLVKFEIIAWSV